MMWRAADEPDAVYAYAADQVTVSADGRIYKFRLRNGITFHDGSPIKAEDVAFSLTTLKTKGHPAIGNLLRDMEAAETEGDRIVVVRFAPNRARSAPLTVANLPILSKAYYTTHPFDETSMEPPLGSGPYKVGKFEQGRYVEFERVKDWWGANLPITRGQYNFDVLRYDYYRDRDTAFEGFTSKSYTFREEFTSRVWATRYDFPAIKDGRVKRESIPDERPSGMQAWMINTRRPKFQDVRVRASPFLCVRFRMGEQEPDVRRLCADAVVLPELRHDGEGQAVARRAGAARAIQGQAAGRCFRRSLEFAGERRLRPGPPAVAAVGGAAQHRRLDRQGRQARQRQGRAAGLGVPGVRAGVGAAPCALHQEPGRARHRCHDARGGSGAVPLPHAGVRLRHLDEPDIAAAHAGRRAARLLLQQVGRRQRLSELLAASPIRWWMR